MALGRRAGAGSEVPVFVRLARVLAVIAVVAGAVAIAVSTGAIPLPRAHHRSGADSEATLAANRAAANLAAANRAAANQRWVSGLCTNLLAWKKEIQRDGTGLGLGLGAVARIRDATSATTRLVGQLDKLGPPPAAQSAQARVAAARLRSEIGLHARRLASAAAGVAGGNLAAIGTLVDELRHAPAMQRQVVTEVRGLMSADLGTSLAQTRACRQLVGIAV